MIWKRTLRTPATSPPCAAYNLSRFPTSALSPASPSFALLRQPRLAVMPVAEHDWNVIFSLNPQ